MSDYTAPTNEIEEKLCLAMAKVLKLSLVGIHDDFYEMGGDSLASIELITECDLPGLNAGEIFRGRTPEKIAKLYEELHENDDGVNPDEKNAASLEAEHPLTAEQLYMIDFAASRYDEASIEKFKDIYVKLNQYNNFPERDGVVLPEDLYGAYERGDAQSVEMMIGTNADELRYWILDLGGVQRYRLMSHVMLAGTMKQISRGDRKRVEAFLLIQPGTDPADRPWKITELYNELLFRLPAVRQGQAHADHGNPVYMYYWRYPSSLPDLRACHAVELEYVFNNLDETVYTGEGINRDLAAEVQRMWVNFALTGNPSTEEHPWEPYSARDRKTMILDEGIYQKINLHETGRRLLYPLLDYRFNGNYTAVTSRIPKAAVIAAAAAGLGLAVLLLWGLLRGGASGEETTRSDSAEGTT